MDDECFAISQRSIWNASRLIKSDFSINRFRLRMVRLEMNGNCKWDKPEPFPDNICVVTGVEELRPVENDYLQRWAVSNRVNSAKADGNDPTLIDPVKQAA